MKKILIVTSDFKSGGITSFLLNLANYLSIENEVTIACQKIGDRISDLSKNIKICYYSVPSNRKLFLKLLFTNNLHHIIRLKKSKRTNISPVSSTQVINDYKAKMSSPISEQYDVAIAASEFFCSYYLNYNVKSIIKIAWVHPDYSKLAINKSIERKTFKDFFGIVTICQSCYQSFLEIFPEFYDKLYCIKNIIDQNKIDLLSKMPISEMDETRLKIVTVCRLDNTSKRIDRIINAVEKMKQKRMDFVWYIVGGGNDYDFLLKSIQKKHLNDYLKLVGEKSNPYPFIKKADAFVLSSQYEGMPIAVSEAIALKCPVIVTNYLSAKEQVNENTGIIINNSDQSFCDELIEAIEKLPTLKKSIQTLSMENINETSMYKINLLINGEQRR